MAVLTSDIGNESLHAVCNNLSMIREVMDPQSDLSWLDSLSQIDCMSLTEPHDAMRLCQQECRSAILQLGCSAPHAEDSPELD